MFHLNKTSQIVTVSPDIVVSDYENRLNQEGLTGGYLPLAGAHVSIGSCLASRIPNLYFLKYGGIEELCVGGKVSTPLRRDFQMKTAPRVATGCDLRRVVVGSQNLFGEFQEATLRVYSQPEMTAWGLAFFESPNEAFESFRKMVSLMIRPLFVKILDEEEGSQLMRSLNLQEEEKTIMAFKLAGLKGMVKAEMNCLSSINEGKKVHSYWPSLQAEIELLDEIIITPEAHYSLCKKFSPLIGGEAKKVEAKFEDQFRKYFRMNAV